MSDPDVIQIDARVSQNLIEALDDLDRAMAMMAKHSVLDNARVDVAHARGLLRSTYTMIRPGDELENDEDEYAPAKKGSIKKVFRNIGL